MPPTTTISAETTLAPETTASPATTVPPETHTEFTVDLICQMLDEAGEYLDCNAVITLPDNEYSRVFLRHQKGLVENGIVSVVNDQIMVLDCSNADWRDELLFLLCMNLMIERYPDCYVNRVVESSGYSTLYFFSGYKELGYESVSDWYWSTQAPFDENEYFVQFQYEYGVIARKEMQQGTRLYIHRIRDDTDPTEYEKYIQRKSEG
jgi:hypothetical protein